MNALFTTLIRILVVHLPLNVNVLLLGYIYLI